MMPISFNGKRTVSLIVLRKLLSICKRMKLDPYITSCFKTTMKRLSNEFLDMTPKAQAIKEKYR